MIDLLFVVLFQAAAGAPQAPNDAAATGTPPTQQNAPASEQGAQPSQAQEKHQVRCRRQRVTGSRLGRVVCMTDEQREEISDESRDLVNRAQSQMGTSGQ
jgi:hypothetical protein